MRIPEPAQNNGPYYEENGAPWQHNGVVMEGAHAVGAGDAPYVHPAHVYSQPQRPPHMPAPGYVVAAGPYYGGYGPAPPMPAPAPAPDDFSDYMWMENEEEFDKQVMQQLEEEALMEQCIEAMLEDERAGERQRLNGHSTSRANGGPSVSLEEQVSKSTLNPLAAEFVPTRSAASSATASPPHTSIHEKPLAPAPVEVSVNDVVSVSEPAPARQKAEAAAAAPSETKQIVEICDIPVPPTAQTETPAEINENEAKKTDSKAKSKDTKKDERPKVEAKKAEPKPAKTEAKPKVEAKPKAEGKVAKTEMKSVKTEAKPTVVKAELKQVKTEAKPTKSKSEVKVAMKTAPKKEVRSVKSEVRLEPREVKAAEAEATPAPTAPAPSTPATEIVKSQPTAIPEPAMASAAAIPKPINYAAAARANKPKKADK